MLRLHRLPVMLWRTFWECQVTNNPAQHFCFAPSDDLFSSRCTHARTHARRLFTQEALTVGPAMSIHLLWLTHGQIRTFACHLVFCSERGLEGKPQHSSEEQQGRGKSLSHISRPGRGCGCTPAFLFATQSSPRRCSCFTVLVVKNSCHFGLKRRQQVRQHGAVRPGRGHNERWESVKSDYT